jgi:hypothetical protein
MHLEQYELPKGVPVVLDAVATMPYTPLSLKTTECRRHMGEYLERAAR